MNKVIISAVLVAISSNSYAIGQSYDCRVNTVQEVTKEGNVINNTEHLKKQIGSTFSVEKKTGKIRGGYFINNRYAKSIEVSQPLENGSYFVISKSYGPDVMINYLYIDNRKNSIENEFTYISGGNWIYTGLCQ